MVSARACRECGLRLVRSSWRYGARRALSTGSTSSAGPSADLRELMRHVAQPVAVVSAILPKTSQGRPVFHGATLSSFTSIALHPEPLVAFSLRLPSRMADALRLLLTRKDRASRISVALLSTALQPTARAFSRPLESHSHLYDDNNIWGRSTEEGLPIARQALGNLICEVSHSLDLAQLATQGVGAQVEAGSEMFICKVVRVESGTGEEGEEGGEPLLYLRHKFVRPGQEIPEKGGRQ